MRTVEGSVLGIELPKFEERVAALAAVATVEGLEHPLVVPGDVSTAEHTLYDDLAVGEDVPVLYEAEAAGTIVHALEVVAEEDSDSPYKEIAAYMLEDYLGRPHEPSEELFEAPKVTPLPPRPTQRPPQPPRKPEGQVSATYVSLQGFGEVLAVLRAGQEFSTPDEQDLVEDVADEIKKMEDPFNPEPIEYLGATAASVFTWVNMAGARGDRYHTDAVSRRLVERGQANVAPPTEDNGLLAA